MKIYLTGGWGYGNKGDNAIFEAMIASITAAYPGCEFVISSFNVEETRIQHGLEAIPSAHFYLTKKAPLGLVRWASLFLWYSTGMASLLLPSLRVHLEAIKKCDVLVLGGGGYINDEWVDMLSSRFVEIQMAHSLRKPIVIYGQTVGPIGKFWTRPIFRHFIHKVTRIAYRDEQSRKVLDFASYPSERMMLTADEVNLIALTPPKNPLPPKVINVGVMIQKLRAHLGPMGPTPRGRIKSAEQYVSEIAEALIMVAKRHAIHYHFIPSTNWDEPVCRKVYERISNEVGATFYPDPHIKDFMSICQNVDVMVSTNMHPIILASTNAKPSVALSYHYKLDDYMKSINQSDNIVRIDDFDSATLVAIISRVIVGKEVVNIDLPKAMARNNIKSLATALGVIEK